MRWGITRSMVCIWMLALAAAAVVFAARIADRHRNRASPAFSEQAGLAACGDERPPAKPAAVAQQTRDRFDALADRWQRDTMVSSSSTEIIGHECYRQVIAMGAEAVPLVLAEMAAGHLHWGQALAEITGENPADGATSPRSATDAWLGWGRARGLVH